jgi:putative hemolysin
MDTTQVDSGEATGISSLAVPLMVMQLTAGSESTIPSASSQDAGPPCGNDGQSDRLGMANPAATYCRELGYDYRVGRSSKGEEGICVFPDGKECEEWKFLSGKCGRERSYCARQGLDVVTKNNGADSLSPESAECVSGGREVGSVSELMGLSEKATKEASTHRQRTAAGEEPPHRCPASFDWRNEGGVDWMTSVKDQGGCGSCWALSMVGLIEGAYYVQSGSPNLDLDLAEEYLVSDC